VADESDNSDTEISKDAENAMVDAGIEDQGEPVDKVLASMFF
jgi:hypothetical protein